jgi:hypothetical protein
LLNVLQCVVVVLTVVQTEIKSNGGSSTNSPSQLRKQARAPLTPLSSVDNTALSRELDATIAALEKENAGLKEVRLDRTHFRRRRHQAGCRSVSIVLLLQWNRLFFSLACILNNKLCHFTHQEWSAIDKNVRAKAVKVVPRGSKRRQLVTLQLSCTDLPKSDWIGAADAAVVVMVGDAYGQYKEAGRTEVVPDDNSPTFTNKVTFARDENDGVTLELRVYESDGA